MVYQRMEQQAAKEADDGDGERTALEAEETALLKVLIASSDLHPLLLPGNSIRFA